MRGGLEGSRSNCARCLGFALNQYLICPMKTEVFFSEKTRGFCLSIMIMWKDHKPEFWFTWSSLLVCRRRCLRKSKREHFRTRMRSVVPSARWAAGERPLGLRGQAQLILAALMARNFPRIVLHSSSLSATKPKDRLDLSYYCCCLYHSGLCASSQEFI